MELDAHDIAVENHYKLLVGCVVPRPIAFVSSVSPGGGLNLAPFSYFTVASNSPPSLLISISGRKSDGAEKDTLRNARARLEGGVGEFVINVAIESYAAKMASAAAPLAYEDSEFGWSGLTPAPSRRVTPPRVAESPVAFECRTSHVIPVGLSTLIIGEIVHVYVRDDLIDDQFRVDPELLAAVGRMAGDSYCRTRDRFDLPNSRTAEGAARAKADLARASGG